MAQQSFWPGTLALCADGPSPDVHIPLPLSAGAIFTFLAPHQPLHLFPVCAIKLLHQRRAPGEFVGVTGPSFPPLCSVAHTSSCTALQHHSPPLHQPHALRAHLHTRRYAHPPHRPPQTQTHTMARSNTLVLLIGLLLGVVRSQKSKRPFPPARRMCPVLASSIPPRFLLQWFR